MKEKESQQEGPMVQGDLLNIVKEFIAYFEAVEQGIEADGEE